MFVLSVTAALLVGATAADQSSLLGYVAERSDLSSQERTAWERAVKLQFGGKALQEGPSEERSVAKSVISGAIFHGISAKKGAKAALDAYHDASRWVPPPLAANWHLLAIQGRRLKASARQMAFRFPRYFDAELAPDLVVWWRSALQRADLPDTDRREIERTLRETLVLMRPQLLDELWLGAELEKRAEGDTSLNGELRELRNYLATTYEGVVSDRAVNDSSRSFYARYSALARRLGRVPKAAPTSSQRAPSPTTEKATPAPRSRLEDNAQKPKRQEPRARKPSPVRPRPPEEPDSVAAEWRREVPPTVHVWKGTPYRWGGTSQRGVDCSGFSREVFRQAAAYELPRTSRSQAHIGTPVVQTQLRLGDLVFFDTLDRGHITHVGIYLGDGKFAHASSSRGVVVDKLEKRYYQRAFRKARRPPLP